MKKNIFIIISIFFITYSNQLVAQDKKFTLGMGFKSGYSQNAESINSNSASIHTSLFSYSVVGYGVLKFKSKSPDRTPIFSYLRTSLSASSRGGFYNVADTPTKITFSHVDLDLMLPITYPVSNDLNFYFGFGGMVSILSAQTKSTPKNRLISPGALAEMGLFTNRGSYFACQLLGVYNDYSTQTLSLTFGMSVGDAKAPK